MLEKKSEKNNFVYGALLVCIFIILLNMMRVTATWVGLPQTDSWQNVGNFTVHAEILVFRVSFCAMSIEWDKEVLTCVVVD